MYMHTFKSHINYGIAAVRHCMVIYFATFADLLRFKKFVEGVFYVGKGKGPRSLQHIKDTRDGSVSIFCFSTLLRGDKLTVDETESGSNAQCHVF